MNIASVSADRMKASRECSVACLSVVVDVLYITSSQREGGSHGHAVMSVMSRRHSTANTIIIAAKVSHFTATSLALDNTNIALLTSELAVN